MATITHEVTTPDTGNLANTSGAFTPAVGDVIVVFATVEGQVGTKTLTGTGGADLAYTQIRSAETFRSGASGLYAFISDTLVTSATSSTVVIPAPGSGSILSVYTVTGLGKGGLAVVRGQGGQSEKAAGAPAPSAAFAQAALTANPILAALANATNPAGMTSPAVLAESQDTGYTTGAVHGLETALANSGVTAQTITWGSNSASISAAIVLELSTGDTFTKTGTGIVTMSAGGERERPPQTYIKEGLTRLGLRPSVVQQRGSGVSDRVGSGVSQKVTGGGPIVKTGQAISARVGAGTDAVLFTEAGAGISARIGVGPDAEVRTKTGAGVSARDGFGADVAIRQRTSGRCEIRSVVISDTAGVPVNSGNFTMTFKGQTTAGVDCTAQNAATTQAALEALPNIDPGDVVVTNRTLGGSEQTNQLIEFRGQWAYQDIPQNDFTVNGGTMTDFTIAVGNFQQGYVGGELGAIGSGASQRLGGSVKAGTGTAGFSAAAGDQVTFTESGAAVSTRTAGGFDQATFTESGSGISARVSSASDQATFGDAGAGVLSAVASGAKVVGGGATYTKAGTVIMGTQQGAYPVKASAGVAGFSASGTSQKLGTFSKVGSGVSARVGSGPRTILANRSGLGISTRGRFEQGAQTGTLYLWMWGIVQSTVGVSEKVSPSGTTYQRQNSGVLVLAAQAADAVTHAETGTGFLNASGGGIGTKAGVTTKTGSGVRGSVAAGADQVIFSETGSGFLNAAGGGVSTKAGISAKGGSGIAGLSTAGTDATTHVESGSGTLNASGGGVGTKAGLNVKAGSGVSGFSAAGADQAITNHTGAGVRGLVGSAADAITYTEAGAGVLAAVASGTKQTQQGVIYTKAGTGITVFTEAGPKVRLLQRYGVAITERRASATDAVLWQQAGTGILTMVGSGPWTPLVIPGDVSLSDGGGNGLVLTPSGSHGVALEDESGAALVLSDTPS